MMDPGRQHLVAQLPPPGSPAILLQSPLCAPCSFIITGVADFLQLFLPMFTYFLLCSLVLSKPVGDFITLVKNLPVVLIIDLALKFSSSTVAFMLNTRTQANSWKTPCPIAYHFSFVLFSFWTICSNVFLMEKHHMI